MRTGLGLRRRASQVGSAARGRLDARRLQAAHSGLSIEEGELASLQRMFLQSHHEYVSHLSPADMAASLPTLAYLYFLCRATRARSVLDLGSGLSSYVLRCYARDAAYPVSVTSVDDDAKWLARTEEFLRENGCGDVGALSLWSDYQSSPAQRHDVVFHDLAGGEVREEAMPFAVAQVAPGGLIVLDDAQHPGHRARMGTELSAAAMQIYSLRRWTLDGYGRWAVLGVPRRTT